MTMVNLGRAVLILVLSAVLLISACGKSERTTTPAHAYKKDDVSLVLPKGWEVFEDVLHPSGLRSIAVVTHAGSIVTIDIYPKSGYQDALPTLEQYLKGYLQSSLDHEEAKKKALIDYGESSRGGADGLFMDITLSEPFNVQYFVETYPKRSADKLAYITFNTPQEQLEEVQPYIDEFIHYMSLGN